MALGDLRAGVDPVRVLPTAIQAAREHAAVEAGQVDVAGGLSLVTVRFEASDDLLAATVGRAVVERVAGLVVIESGQVTRRCGARWEPLD